MQLQDFYPIIVTEHLEACRDFYRRWFDFEVVFEATWFVRPTPSAPPGPEVFTGKGMCLEFQVPDARAEYARFQAGKASIVLELRDEPFGQRRFGLFDPAGVWIDILEQIEPAPGFWEPYLPRRAEA